MKNMLRRALIWSGFLLGAAAVLFFFWITHSGCHRWHACQPLFYPSYMCGDLGYCGQCPDNRYCADGHRRAARIGADARTKTADCVRRDRLPDPDCTPGDAFANATVAEICRYGYSRRVRNVSIDTARSVYAEYGVGSHGSGEYEVDHLIPLELGGSNDIANLWPQPALPPPGFHEKDGLENELHAAVCGGRMALRDAQEAIATDWLLSVPH